ncbi:VTT domain-containing protein [Cellulomonas sp. KRMCY2]|uniref:VTT domain-containing protein n=1 Tax=Cellulomonas sp. KRMCY2 TaxID=1304865 RepID=UPI0004B004C0|nr:VTT domain-containing protein [Cellulomonas sp. KRMCY2]
MTITSALAATLTAGGPLVTLGPDWLKADYLIESFGAYALIGVCVIVFIETGLLFPLLPGDSLLFTAGALVAQDKLDFPLWLLCTLLFAAAFLGDQTAYLIGHTAGPRIFNRPDSRIFKQSHIAQTNAYFERYGGRTIIIARFIPFVRTYSAVAAGVGKMRYRHFVAYDVVGALLWGVGVTLLGYALGNVTFIKNNIEILLMGVVLVSVAPVVIELWRKRRAVGTVVENLAVEGSAEATGTAKP